MRNWLIYVGLIFTFFACKQARNYTDPNKIFSVNFVNEPILAVDSFETSMGKVVLHSFMEEASDFKARMVTYSDYPESIKQIEDVYVLIDGAKDGALTSLGIDFIEKEEKLSLQGYPGVEIYGRNDLNFHIHYKLVLKDNRLYQIGLLTEGLPSLEEKELDFVESFVFL